MRIPLSWLRDFAPFGDDFVALGETFDDLGMVVEGITRVGEGLDGVVIARVLSIEAIPKADKVRKVMADVGEADPVQVARAVPQDLGVTDALRGQQGIDVVARAGEADHPDLHWTIS